MKKLILSIIAFSIVLTHGYSQELRRRASWQARIAGPSAHMPGAKIMAVEKNTPLEKAGLSVSDLIIKVDGVVANMETWTNITYSIREGVPVEISYKRGIELRKVTVKLNGIARETHPNIDTYYESVTSDFGITQRVIITKPESAFRKQPAMIILQGLSCSTIEKYPGRSNNWVRVLNDLVEKSGMVVLRVDKPGVGDSEGDCGDTDFATELAGYHEAVRLLKSKRYVDTTNIIVYGSSMGSALGPYIANQHNLAGVISDGTFFKTWFEHMLEIERRILQMEGKSEQEINNRINNISIPLYYGMLIEKKTFGEVIRDNSYLKGNNRHSARHMYGRPVSYYQQVQDFNFAKAWENLTIPVRIMRGTNDWIMTDIDNDMILSALEKSGHKDFSLHRFEGLDHWNTIHESPDNSFYGKPGQWHDDISGIIIQWAQEMTVK
jgi:pimeloyl-ACP methyl ester carboxylesterase